MEQVFPLWNREEKMGSSTDVPYHPSHENAALEFCKLLPYK
jgi:hypothetical protein